MDYGCWSDHHFKRHSVVPANIPEGRTKRGIHEVIIIKNEFYYSVTDQNGKIVYDGIGYSVRGIKNEINEALKYGNIPNTWKSLILYIHSNSIYSRYEFQATRTRDQNKWITDFDGISGSFGFHSGAKKHQL